MRECVNAACVWARLRLSVRVREQVRHTCVAARVGVICEPGKFLLTKSFLEILELDLCKDDKFIVIASDGVWEFI